MILSMSKCPKNDPRVFCFLLEPFILKAFKKYIMNVPNILTSIRIILVPFLVLVFYLPFDNRYLVSAGIFAFAAATDWFDGYLARKLNQTTPFGEFFDPVADKIMVATALCLLVEDFNVFWITIPAMIIIGREIVISATAGMDGRIRQAYQRCCQHDR